jgi:hypothetical protein
MEATYQTATVLGRVHTVSGVHPGVQPDAISLRAATTEDMEAISVLLKQRMAAFTDLLAFRSPVHYNIEASAMLGNGLGATGLAAHQGIAVGLVHVEECYHQEGRIPLLHTSPEAPSETAQLLLGWALAWLKLRCIRVVHLQGMPDVPALMELEAAGSALGRIYDAIPADKAPQVPLTAAGHFMRVFHSLAEFAGKS